MRESPLQECENYETINNTIIHQTASNTLFIHPERLGRSKQSRFKTTPVDLDGMTFSPGGDKATALESPSSSVWFNKSSILSFDFLTFAENDIESWGTYPALSKPALAVDLPVRGRQVMRLVSV
jgi:hypothetical protein